MTFLHSLAKFLVAPMLAVLSFAGYSVPVTQTSAPAVQQNAPKNLQGFNPSGSGTYRLQSSIGTSNTTVNLSSFKEPISNIAYSMAYMNTDIAYGTLDPQQPSLSEFISFTGITQNSDGSAQLTGVTRGLSRSYPYTASSTVFAKAHAGQSIFILSNSPNFQNEYVTKRNAEDITGLKTFETPPILIDANATSTSQAASRGYINGLVQAGVATSTETNFGGVWLATKLQQASSTDGSPLTPFVLQSKNATSSFGTGTGGLKVVVTNNAGKLDSNFIDQNAPYTWGTATSTFNATTSISAIASSSPLILNGVSYGFPSTQGASSTVLVNNGNGNIKWQFPLTGITNGVYSTTTPASKTGVTTITLGFKPRIIRFSWAYICAGATSFSCYGSGSYVNGTYAETYGFNNTSAGSTAQAVTNDSSNIISGEVSTTVGAFSSTVSNVTSTGFNLNIVGDGSGTTALKISYEAQE